MIRRMLVVFSRLLSMFCSMVSVAKFSGRTMARSRSAGGFFIQASDK